MKPKSYVPFLMMLLLTGCASLGLATPESFDQRLAAAYMTHTAVMQASTDSLTAHEMTSEEAESVLKIADESKLVLDGARAAFVAGDMQTAEGKLALGTSVLRQLQDYLRRTT